MHHIIIHKDRALIEIKGDDRKKFLQGLITNDVEKVSQSHLIYSCMLNPKGRFLYDFFIFERNDSLFLDCFEPRRDEIIKKLKFYKLRSKVEIIKDDALICVQYFTNSEDKKGIKDPRHLNLGFRGYITEEQKSGCEILPHSQYDMLRIENKIPESELDLTYEKSIILEFGFDDLNAIDYQKGCYVGQELTARTHYKGEIRKKLIHITIDNMQKIEKGEKFSCEGKTSGIVLSSVFHENQLHALALVRLENSQTELDKIENLEFETHKITLIG